MSEENFEISKNRQILSKQSQPHLRKLEDFLLQGANTSLLCRKTTTLRN